MDQKPEQLSEGVAHAFGNLAMILQGLEADINQVVQDVQHLTSSIDKIALELYRDRQESRDPAGMQELLRAGDQENVEHRGQTDGPES
jgi:uncharacterized protein YaaN involved in tellurite resistance